MSSEHSETDISTMSESDTQVLMQLMAPDGYYTYLKIPKPASDKDEIDLVLLKKNYRKLSLKHHPDRVTGHVETFRALNRAHLVLLHSKLRQQYDLLGIDLEEDHHDDGHDNHKEEEDEDDDKKRDESNSAAAPDTLVSAFASAALAGVLQAIVRTVMMGLTAVLLTRYLLLIVPAGLFLVFTAWRIKQLQGFTGWGACHPLVLGLGLVLMHYGRELPEMTWSFSFWIGEALVATMFTYSTLPPQETPTMFAVIAVCMFILTLWTRGNVWKYTTLTALQVILALVLALVFPILEMFIEAILNEKLKKVGDKIRAQHVRMEAYYAAKQ
jgi:uncharacterized membrane protein YvlD (DUF360 family)